MLTLPPSVKIYMASEPVDLRRGHDGLGAIVRNQWELDLYGGHLFVFVGRRRDRCKVLFFDRGGFVLYYKRLERGRFRLPRVADDAQLVRLDATALGMLLDGIDFGRVRRPRHWQPPSTPGHRPSQPSLSRSPRGSHLVRHRSDAPTESRSGVERGSTDERDHDQS